MADTIQPPQRFVKITKQDGFMETPFADFLNEVTKQINFLQTAEGTGTPEGNVVASPGKRYLDTATNQEYYKKTGDGDTGWVTI